MTQMKVFKDSDSDRLENNVNRWLHENDERFEVVSVSTSVVPGKGITAGFPITAEEGIKLQTQYITMVSYKDKPKNNMLLE